MNPIDEANRLLHGCESQIRALIESALTERQYDVIAHLASLASSLAALSNHRLPETSVDADSTAIDTISGTNSSTASATRDIHESRRSPQASRQRGTEFPRFERHGDRLVKLGWSKKERTIYEHRAPLEVVRAVTAKLASSAKKGGYLKMDEVLPIRTSDGSEVPSYQAYLVLAWLRDKGVARRLGNDGYKLLEKHLNDEKVEDLWSQTPERA